MEQNGRNKKTFKNNGQKRPGKKTYAAGGDAGKDLIKKRSDDRNGNRQKHGLQNEKRSTPTEAVAVTDLKSELLPMEELKRPKKSRTDYSSSYTLIESFEAEEKNSLRAGANDGEDGFKSDTMRFEKGAENGKRNGGRPQKKPRNALADSVQAAGEKSVVSSIDEKRPRNKKNGRNASDGKNPKGKKRYPPKYGFVDTAPEDDSIRTRSNTYVHVDYSDDDIIPENAFEYDAPETEKNRFTAAERRSESAIPGAVVGRNAVRELLRNGRSVDKLYIKSGNREGSIVVLVAEAVSRKIPIVEVSQDKLDALSGGANHQGVVALAAEKQYTDIDSILAIAEERGEMPFVVIADGIEDPQNLGTLIRCAECAGAHGIIIPKRRAVGLTPTVTKSSAGAIEHMAIAKVSNLADAVDKLKKAGLWIFAAEAGGAPYYETDFNVPTAIVLGSEGFGVGRLIKEKSDFTVSIPMYGHVNSLNVATAASVILCHVARIHHGS